MNKPAWWFFAILPLVAAGGCINSQGKKLRLDAITGIYDSANITYRLDASRLSEPVELAHIQNQLVSYEVRTTAPVPNSSVGTLSIQYPHPEGKPGFAFCRVEIESRAVPPPTTAANQKATKKKLPSWPMSSQQRKDLTITEVWLYDLPKVELDRAIGQMNDTGFFTVARAYDAGVDIHATLDGAKRNKVWRQVPQLDAIMAMVRRQGELVAYSRPPGAVKNLGQPFSSVQAYREMVAREQLQQRQVAGAPGTPAAPAMQTAGAAQLPPGQTGWPPPQYGGAPGQMVGAPGLPPGQPANMPPAQAANSAAAGYPGTQLR